jgi:hypothetical protein
MHEEGQKEKADWNTHHTRYIGKGAAGRGESGVKRCHVMSGVTEMTPDTRHLGLVSRGVKQGVEKAPWEQEPLTNLLFIVGAPTTDSSKAEGGRDQRFSSAQRRQ